MNLKLLNWQKNEIAIIIKKSGLIFSDFSIEERRNGDQILIDCVFYKRGPIQYGFAFDKTSDSWYLIMTPGKESQASSSNVRDWESVKSYFRNWIAYLKREIDAPNLWDEFTKSSFENSMGNQIYNSNQQFTQNEQNIIATHIDSVIIQLKGYDSLTSEQLDRIESELTYLKEQLKNQTKKAWMYELRGVMFTLLVERVIDSEIAREIFTQLTTKVYDAIHAIGASIS